MPGPISDVERRAALAQSAADTFIRFGYRKASMDAIAAAGGLSRQGLYLHFANKETAFREAVSFLAECALSALTEALDRSGLDLEERIYAAFMAMDARVFGAHDSAHVQDLFASAAEVCPDIVQTLDRRIIAAVARALGADAHGTIPPKTLAEHLYVVSYGFKYRGLSRPEYASRMRAAVRIVCAARTA